MKSLIAPWRCGNTLSCSVFDANGAIVASVYGATKQQQIERRQLVEAAPELLHLVEQFHEVANGVDCIEKSILLDKLALDAEDVLRRVVGGQP